MSIFVSTTYFGDGSKIQDAIDELQRMDINHVELGSNHAPCDIQTLRLYPNAQYIIHNYFPAQDPNFVLNLASENKEVREKSIAFIKNTIKICHKFNIKYYTIHPGFFAEAISPSKIKKDGRNFDFVFKSHSQDRGLILKMTVEIIKSLYQFAQDNNVQLLVENQGSKTSRQFVLFVSPEELDMLKKRVGDILKFNFNLAHAALAGINLGDSKIFYQFFKSSEFFEVSEITGHLDSHLPIQNRGEVASLIRKYASYFAKKNIILEYRNINIKEVKKSYNLVTKLLNPSSPKGK